MSSAPLLQTRALKVHYPVSGNARREGNHLLRAVDGVDMKLQRGKTLGVVGESGCGKSTLIRAILGFAPISAGDILVKGASLKNLKPKAWRSIRKSVQIIYQDPLASLDPRMVVRDIIAEPMRALLPRQSRSQIHERVSDLLQQVGLSTRHMERYPHEFSGGQCQRIGIARALAVHPELVLCDEPVSALDVSVQAQIINLLQSLQVEHGLAMLFVAHDLSVVRHISHEVMVMYLGQVVEYATRDELFSRPTHPYTQALMMAVPIPDPRRARNRKPILLAGEPPSPTHPPPGCRFHQRCPLAQPLCRIQPPELRAITPLHAVACHFAEQIQQQNFQSRTDG